MKSTARTRSPRREVGLPAHEPRGLYWDPFAVLDTLGYRDKPTPITFNTLRLLPYKTPVLSGMILNAARTLVRITRPPADRMSGTGLICRPKGMKPGQKLKGADAKFAEYLERGLQRGCFNDQFDGYLKLSPFTLMMIWCSYTFDQACFEVIDDYDGYPVTWLPADGASMRLANAPYTFPQGAKFDPDVAFTSQIHDGQIVQQYSFYDLAFCVRNPRADLVLGGYGTSEGEMIAHTLARMINIDEYHARLFGQGVHARGIVNLKGETSPEKFSEFRRDLNQQLSGVRNAFTTPVTRAPNGIEFINFGASNKEMEFSSYYDHLIKITGAHMLMDPAEVHFKYGNTGQARAMSEESNRERVSDSRARWLPPLADWWADQLTTYLVERLDRDWEAAYINLDAPTAKEQAEINKTRVESTHSVNEVRTAMGMEERDDGDRILNNVMVQYNAAEQAAQMPQDGGEGGMPGAPGGQPGGADGAGGKGKNFDDLLSELGDGGDEDDDEEEAKPARMGKSFRTEMEV